MSVPPHATPSILSIKLTTSRLLPPGKAIAPFVDRMIKKYPEARFYQYDTDTADDISQELGASQMPTFHAFKDGDLVGSVTGAKAAQLEALIKESYGGKVVED